MHRLAGLLAVLILTALVSPPPTPIPEVETTNRAPSHSALLQPGDGHHGRAFLKPPAECPIPAERPDVRAGGAVSACASGGWGPPSFEPFGLSCASRARAVARITPLHVLRL